MEIPNLLQIESSTACDAICEFCPHKTMQRQKGQMTDELFLKIINEAQTLNIKEVLLFLNGEPFLFKRFFQWLAELRARHMKTVIFTNASQLTKEKSDQLVKFSDVVNKVFFSISGKDQDTYRQIMGLDYSQVLNNIKYFVSINSGRIPIEGHMPLYSRTSSWVKEWKSLWKPILGQANTTHMYNWAGDIQDQSITSGTNAYCGRLNHMTVLWNGQVVLCCMDIEGRVILGDLNTQSIIEVFNGLTATSYREDHRTGKRKDKELCKKCNMI